jgi:hypothetical protein
MQEFNKSSRRSFFGKISAASLGVSLSGSLGMKLFAQEKIEPDVANKMHQKILLATKNLFLS